MLLSTEHPFKYGGEPVPWFIRIWQKIGAVRTATPRTHLLRKSLSVVMHKLWGHLVFVCVIAKFDAFVFIYGQTITNTRLELWLLKYFKKKIIFVYVGSDSRPPYMDGGQFAGLVGDPLPSASFLRAVTRRSKRKIRLHEKYADFIINSPATAHFHELPYINWFAMGIPRVFPACLNVSPIVPGITRPVRILHSPSNPLVKGTDEILAVLDKLCKKGYSIELINIQNMPNEIVLKELAGCDFIVDQLYSDTPLATFATEAAFFGKPAVVGGYCAGNAKQILNLSDLPPSLFVVPGCLETAIEHLIVDTDFRECLGRKARQFVLSQWSLSGVAGRYLQLLNNDVPAQWWCDPASVSYVRGCGLPEGRTRQLIQILIENFGIGALQVCDKPNLETAVMDFVMKGEGEARA